MLACAPEDSARPQGVYYVAPGGSDGADGSLANPWATIQHAAETLGAGDTVQIRAGTYRERVVPRNSGSPGCYITYAAFPGETPTIDGSGVPLSEDFAGLLEIADRSYLHISGLRVVNAGPLDNNAAILVVDSSHIILKNNTTYNSVSSGIGVWGSDHVTVTGNTVEHACTDIWQECLTVATTSDFEVSDNTVFDCPEEGICIKDGVSNGRVHGNLIRDGISTGLYVDAWDKHTRDIRVYRNRVHGIADNGIALASEMGGLLENIFVYNNLAHDNRFCGISVTLNGDAARHPMRNIQIVNNTFCGNGCAEWGGGINQENPDAEQVLIRNNIASRNVCFQLSLSPDVSPAGQRFDHNLIEGFRGTEGEIRGDSWIEGDPLFVNAPGGDFHLLRGSPAIDSGWPEGAPEDDFDGQPRPQDGNGDGLAEVDIGADERPGEA